MVHGPRLQRVSGTSLAGPLSLASAILGVEPYRISQIVRAIARSAVASSMSATALPQCWDVSPDTWNKHPYPEEVR